MVQVWDPDEDQVRAGRVAQTDQLRDPDRVDREDLVVPGYARWM